MGPWIEGPNFKFNNFDGTSWYCQYGMFPNGSTKWLVARSIEEKTESNSIGEKEVIE